MRIPLLFRAALITLLLPLAVGAVQAQEGLPVRTIAEFRGFKVWDVAPVAGGQRIYYTAAPDPQSDADALWLYDVASRQSTQIASGPMGRWSSLSISRAGDRIAFKRREEGGTALQLWTLPLDPGTGLATGPARRTSVSNTTGRPSFSPDGSNIVFVRSGAGSERSLAVVPANGGAERLLVQSDLRVEWGDWSADGEWVYFEGWSDLFFTRGASALYRIPAAGGEAKMIDIDVPMGFGYPGRSPDGRLFAHEAPDFMSTVLSDSIGGRLGMIPWAHSWVSPTELLELESGHRMGLKSVTLSDGVVRDVLPPMSGGSIGDVAWAPDGRRFAALAGIDLLVAFADGSGVRTFPLSGEGSGSGIQWSPDGRSIALVRNAPYGSRRAAGSHGATPMDLIVVDAETGAVRTLPTVGENIRDLRWTQGSRRLRYANEAAGPSGTPALTSIRETGLDGPDTLLAQPTPSTTNGVGFISDSTVFLRVDSLTYVHSLTTGRSVLVFSLPSPNRPVASPSGKLLAMRPPNVPRGSGRTTAALITPTGEPVATVDFGMNVGPNVSRGAIFTPDEQRLITSGGPPGQCCQIRMAPIDGGPFRTLVDLLVHGPAGSHGNPVLALSPDGNTLLFTYGGELATRIKIYDISPMLTSPPPR